MEIPLGSLGEFLDLSYTATKTRAQTAKTEPYSISYRQVHGRQYSGAATTPTAKPSAKQYFSGNSRSFHNIKADNSNYGYCFTNSIKLVHERVRLQSQQQPRSITRGATLKSRPKTTESKTSKKTTVTKKIEEDATKPLEDLENNVRGELQMRANHFLIRTMKKEQALINQEEVIKQHTSDSLFYELAGHVMNIHKEETRAKTPDNNHYRPTLNKLSFESALQKCAQSSMDFWLKKRGIVKERKIENNETKKSKFRKSRIKPKSLGGYNEDPSNKGSRLTKLFNEIRLGNKVYRRLSSGLPSEEPEFSKNSSPILKDIKEAWSPKRSHSFTKSEAGTFSNVISRTASQPKQEIKDILEIKEEEIKEKQKKYVSEIHWKDSSFLIVEEAPKVKRLLLPSREEYFRKLKAKEDSKKRCEVQSDLLKNYQNMVSHVPENKNVVN